MSVHDSEGSEVVDLPPSGDGAFAALMDALVADPDDTSGDEAGAAAGTADAPAAGAGGGDRGGDAAPAREDAGAGEAADAAAGEADGDAGGDQGAAAGSTEQPAAPAGAGALPASWTAEASAVIPRISELSNALEETTSKAYQAAALETVREEHEQYFDALQQHPRLLVGRQVPAIGKEGMEVLRDTADAREWQEAVKSLLVAEVKDRAQRDLEENSDFLETVHASIELFQNNVDLVPGTKNFDVELANEFAKMAEPYELRVDGKLQGYSIPVQPIINQLRTRMQAQRAAAPAAPAAPAKRGRPPGSKAPEEPPQAGIRAKAGASSDGEDFSTLFGTLGLPGLQI